MCALDFGRIVGFGWSPGFGVWVVGGILGFESAWSVSSLVVFIVVYIKLIYPSFFFSCVLFLLYINLISSLFFFLGDSANYLSFIYTSVILAVIKNLRYPLLLTHTFRRYATLRDALQMWVNF